MKVRPKGIARLGLILLSTGIVAAAAVANSTTAVARSHLAMIALAVFLTVLFAIAARITVAVIRSTRPGTPASSAMRYHLIAVLVLIVGTIGSTWTGHITERMNVTITQNRFESLGLHARSTLADWTYRPIYGMHGARGVYAASENVEASEFTDYVASRNLPKEFPGVGIMGFVVPVEADNVASFEAGIRSEGRQGFRLQPSVSTDRRWIMLHAEPAEQGAPMLGVDLAAFPGVADAIATAVANKAPTFVDFQQDPRAIEITGMEHPLLWFTPVYHNHMPVGTPAEREAAIHGVLVATFSHEPITPILAAAIGRMAHATVSVLNDGQDTPTVTTKAGDQPSENPIAVWQSIINMNGTRMVLDLRSTPAFDASVDVLTPTLIRLAGLAVSLSICLLVVRIGTRHERAEARARAMTTDLRNLSVVAENTSNIVIITDAEGHTVWVNHAFTQLTGYTLDEVLGEQPGKVLQFEKTDPVTRAEIRRAIHKAEPFAGEILNRSKDGREYWLQLDIKPIRDEHGVLTGFFALENDLTDRKRFETELQSAKDVAETANEAKSRFLSSMSHEIRTPLNGIIGFADLLRQDAHEGDLSLQAEWIGVIHGSGQHLLSLLNDVLDLSKMDANALDIALAPTNPRRVISETTLLMTPRAHKQGITLDVDVAPDVPDAIRTDATRLRQIVMNLVSNAVKFTERGGIRVDVSNGERDGERTLRIAVRDTGIGMTPDQVASLFVPFQQAGQFIAERFGGTGLGLAISRDLARRLGGDVTVSSAPGVGSAFTIEIAAPPLLDGETMPEANPTAPRNSGGALSKTLAGLSILVVDDIETNRSVARLFLERAGATVTLAEDGAGGIEACRSHRFDIVLMDVQMPGINGIEATRRLRASGFEPPILALTAFSSGGDRDSCLEAGMNDFLGKPFEPSVLMQTISRWCNAERDPATKHRESAIEDEDLRELALDWLRTLPTRLADAANAITAQDYEALGRIAHAIKGTGGSLGLPSFTSLAAELESAVHRRDLQGARLRLVALKREHTAITTRLAA